MKLYILITATLGYLSINAISPANGEDRRLNVLFIAVDDLRPDLNCFGNREIISPNIDALAKQGCLFVNHFVQVATCGASRFSLMTGRLPVKANDLSNHAFEPFKKIRNSGVKPDFTDPNGIVTLPELFKHNGYATVAIGKVSHLADGGDMPGAWDREFNYLPVSRYPEQKIETGNLTERLPAKMIDALDTAFTDGLVTERAIEELQKLQVARKPFFLGVGFHRPHLPFYAPKKYWDLYDRDKLKLAECSETPFNCNREISLHENFELRGQYTQLVVPDEETEARILRHGYYACVSFVDAQIGKILQEIDRLGLMMNTVIVLWGDHGFHLGEYGIYGKHTNFEYALLSPLIIINPAMKKKGSVINGLVETVDIFPTLADICGLPMPRKSDGRSLTPMMINSNETGKGFVRGYLPEGSWRGEKPFGYTVRNERYRLVRWYDRKMNFPLDYIELYDHKNDPGETRNIANERPLIVKELSKLVIMMQLENENN